MSNTSSFKQHHNRQAVVESRACTDSSAEPHQGSQVISEDFDCVTLTRLPPSSIVSRSPLPGDQIREMAPFSGTCDIKTAIPAFSFPSQVWKKTTVPPQLELLADSLQPNSQSPSALRRWPHASDTLTDLSFCQPRTPPPGRRKARSSSLDVVEGESDQVSLLPNRQSFHAPYTSSLALRNVEATPLELMFEESNVGLSRRFGHEPKYDYASKFKVPGISRKSQLPGAGGSANGSPLFQDSPTATPLLEGPAVDHTTMLRIKIATKKPKPKKRMPPSAISSASTSAPPVSITSVRAQAARKKQASLILSGPNVGCDSNTSSSDVGPKMNHSGDEWQYAKSLDGRVYYVNVQTNSTSWGKPPGFKE